jgi:DNA (cytosine-5)-methyltransferase 1
MSEILIKEKVDKAFYIDEEKEVKYESHPQIDRDDIEVFNVLDKWNYLKGRKNEERVSSTGYKYKYAEGAMIFPDPIEEPSRTIITGEGGPSPSRFKHVIKEADGSLRRLTPIELELLNMFPENHTKHEKVTDTKRAFFMGNALVVGVVEKIGNQLSKLI